MPAARRPPARPAPHRPEPPKPAPRPPAPHPANRPAGRPAAPRPAPKPAPRPAQARPAPKPPARKAAPKPAARKPPKPAQARPAPKPAGKPAARKPAARPAPKTHPPAKPTAPHKPPPREAPRAYSGTAAQQRLWASQLFSAANYAKIPFDVEWGVYGMETNFGRYIGTSTASATGLMQFIPDTARAYNYPQTNTPNAQQSQQQFTAAALYLRDLRKQHGSWNSAIVHYSGGGYNLHDVETKGASFPLTDLLPKSAPAPIVAAPVYVNPLAHARVTPERIDQGVDYAGSGYLVAIANGVVVSSVANGSGWEGEGYLEYEITQPGSLKGAHVYYAEGVNPVVHDGEGVRAGARVADLRSPMPHGIELGFAAGFGEDSYYRYHDGGYREGTATRPGIAFSNLIRRLGGPGGKIEGAIVGRFPSYMPTGEPDSDISASTVQGAQGPLGISGFSPAGAAAGYTWPGGYYSSIVQLQRGIGQGAHHSNSAWFYVRGITFVKEAGK